MVPSRRDTRFGETAAPEAKVRRGAKPPRFNDRRLPSPVATAAANRPTPRDPPPPTVPDAPSRRGVAASRDPVGRGVPTAPRITGKRSPDRFALPSAALRSESAALGFCSAAFCRQAERSEGSRPQRGRPKGAPAAVSLGLRFCRDAWFRVLPRSTLSTLSTLKTLKTLTTRRARNTDRAAPAVHTCAWHCPDALSLGGRRILAARAKCPRSVLVESQSPRE